jgi:anti-anti-sigma factor
MLKVHTKKLGAVEVLCLEGHIVTGDTEILRGTVQATSEASDLILDLANVSIVDAHGLGVLLQLREQIVAKGGHFELRNLSQPLYRVFEITRLNTVFEINSSVEFFPRFACAQRVLAAA